VNMSAMSTVEVTASTTVTIVVPRRPSAATQTPSASGHSR
jgi:hypothetical protein